MSATVRFTTHALGRAILEKPENFSCIVLGKLIINQVVKIENVRQRFHILDKNIPKWLYDQYLNLEVDGIEKHKEPRPLVNDFSISHIFKDDKFSKYDPLGNMVKLTEKRKNVRRALADKLLSQANVEVTFNVTIEDK